jgi:hypothetical protein
MRKIFIFFMLFLPNTVFGEELIIDFFSDSSTEIQNHVPNLNNTGHVYQPLESVLDPSYASIVNNQLSLVFGVADKTYSRFYLDLGTNAGIRPIVYEYLWKPTFDEAYSFWFNFRSSHTVESRGSSCSGYAVVGKCNSGNTAAVIYLKSNTANVFATVANSASVTLVNGSNGYYPIKIIDAGGLIEIYADGSGSQDATSLVLSYYSTQNVSNSEISFYANEIDDCAGMNFYCDTLRISQSDPENSPTVTETPTFTVTPTFTETITITYTPTPTITPTASPTPTNSPTYTSTSTPTATVTPTNTPLTGQKFSAPSGVTDRKRGFFPLFFR